MWIYCTTFPEYIKEPVCGGWGSHTGSSCPGWRVGMHAPDIVHPRKGRGKGGIGCPSAKTD